MNQVLSRAIRAGVIAGGLLVASTASAGVYVRYHNDDSVDYKWEAVCHGSTYTVEFGHARTADATIQGDSPCVVKTPKGEVTLKGGENVEIKDGKLTVK